MSYPRLKDRPLHKITPKEANQIYVNFMEYYSTRSKSGPPDANMINWPSYEEFSRNFLPHSAEYAARMGVGMAIDVGGPACRKPDPYPVLSLYSRSTRSHKREDENWTTLWHSQRKPFIELPDGTPFYLLPRVVLPRHMPQTPTPVNEHSTLRNVSLFMPDKPYEVTQPDSTYTESWTVLRVKRSDFWLGRVKEDDRIDGSPSSPETTFLRLDLGPSPHSGRLENDRFSILFRIRISYSNGEWVPWRIGHLEYPEPDSGDRWDAEHQQVIRGHPFAPQLAAYSSSVLFPNQIPSMAHALSHRQRKNYGQTHAGGGTPADEYRD